MKQKEDLEGKHLQGSLSFSQRWKKGNPSHFGKEGTDRIMLKLLECIAGLTVAEAENLLVSAGESTLKNKKSACEWKKILVDSGEFFIEKERTADRFFDDLSLVLAKENMKKLSKDLQKTDGYELKNRLCRMLMQLMEKYEIPHELAESYCMKILYVILEQIKIIEPDKYEHYFLQEWKEEQELCLRELQEKLDKMSNDMACYQKEQIHICSSGQMDITLRRSTCAPSIGIEFFVVDDESFGQSFEEQRYEEMVYVRGRCREETIYCVLNELWRLNEKRPVYVVKSLESWKKLQDISSENNIYIPWFYADEIVAIENNTNIFVLEENTPAYTRDVIRLRPRTHQTLLCCLREAGMEPDQAYALLTDTHGLYIPMKKHLFRGEYLKKPEWMEGISARAKKVCLLVGAWEEIEGDRLIIETLYGGGYESFLEEVLPYIKGEDPFLYHIKGSYRNHSAAYYLASTENAWGCLDISLEDPLWGKFAEVFTEVLNEAENLLTDSREERLLAQMKGEKLFWSETIRKGMVRTLIMKGLYQRTENCQPVMDELISKILNHASTEKQWSYLSTFWTDICEISPKAVLARLDQEFHEPTGLMGLLENQANDFLFERNASVDILWGVEQFLVQKEYVWDGLRWLLKLDSYNYKYPSNSPRDTLAKVFCTWHNFSAVRTPEEKTMAAELALELSSNAWEYLYEAIPLHHGNMVGQLYAPKYRDHLDEEATTIRDMQAVSEGYLRLLLNHMDFSVERWKKMLNAAEEFDPKLRKEVFGRLLCEVAQMTDPEIADIKNGIRHLIYRHRFFASASWAMSEEQLEEYGQLLNDIHTSQPEYEYGYLFLENGNYPLLYPVPSDTEERQAENGRATEMLIQEKLTEFQNKGYQLNILAEFSAREQHSSLGRYLARYWKQGRWDFETFDILVKAQESGTMAIDYMSNGIREQVSLYPDIISRAEERGYSDEILTGIYRSEAFWTEDLPLACHAPDRIKLLFWQLPVRCKSSNLRWAVKESRKYAKLPVYLEQMYWLHRESPLSGQEILEYFEDMESIPCSQVGEMTSYYMKQFLGLIQKECFHEDKKCLRVSQIEVYFMNLLKWEDMKCFHHLIKKSPKLYAQLAAGIFKRDHEQAKEDGRQAQYGKNLYMIYHKAHFCPAEENGEVEEEKLRQWVREFRVLLEQNGQSRLFGRLLGRLFSFSPVGKDGHMPCEAVRAVIEQYSDESLRREYETCVYNQRGMHSPSAGKAEMQISESFRANAEYLNARYPETAKIYYSLSERYKRESECERREAENRWY